MSARQPVIRRTVVLGLLVALLTSVGLVSTAAPAHAATTYKLTATGAGTTTTDKARKLTVTYKKNGKAVKSATVLLQYKKGSKWVTEKKVKVSKGKATVKVKHTAMNRTYRFYVKGKATSKSFVVRFVPAKFAIAGSGEGHGVGMAQWGAYRLAKDGKSAAHILGYYYPGTAVGTANNPGATATPDSPSGKIKVQVLGPLADSRTSTTLTVKSSGFTVLDGVGKQLGKYATPGKVVVGVSGAKVTAKVTLDNGKVKNKALTTSARLKLVWDNAKGTVSVTGAQGSYRYGNLQVTVLQKRPNVVNELVLNSEYLYGIDEMPASWGKPEAKGIEALKAQVIAARTYALRQVTKRSGNAVDPACDCHVFDDTRSQNFTGWKKAGPSANKPWVDAVKATVRANAGMPSGSEVDILRDAAAGFAETPYFASSGSYTAGGTTYSGTGSNADVFRADALPYLVHVDDPYSYRAAPASLKSWTKSLTQAQVRKIFGLADVKSVTVAARYPGGLVKSLRATTSTGTTKTVTKYADDWRRSLGVPGPWIASVTGK